MKITRFLLKNGAEVIFYASGLMYVIALIGLVWTACTDQTEIGIHYWIPLLVVSGALVAITYAYQIILMGIAWKGVIRALRALKDAILIRQHATNAFLMTLR